MKVLMVSTEYPPMSGGVGRYTFNLTQSLSSCGVDVHVACSPQGNGHFVGLSPMNAKNSDLLLDIVGMLKPDVVHVQFEPGLYGLSRASGNGSVTCSYIDKFYRQCKTPIVTTFHTAYSLREWLSQATIVKKSGKTGKLGVPLRAAIRLWSYTLNWMAFAKLNKQILRRSKAGIVLSGHMAGLLGERNCHVIYHGSEPEPSVSQSKHSARSYFGLPQDSKIALAVGFRTVTKGWDLLDKLVLPKPWLIVTNSSKSHYSTETSSENRKTSEVIDLKRGYLGEAELSLLFYASDIVLLPYTIIAGSGVMFDGLAHGKPFVSSDIGFFREFSELGLGIASGRDAVKYANAILEVDKNQEQLAENVFGFREKLRWNHVATEHARIYALATGRNRELVCQV